MEVLLLTLVGAFVVALAFLYLRYLSPLVVKWSPFSPFEMWSKVAPTRVEGRANSFVLYAAVDMQVPTDQWRSISTGIRFRPTPGINLKAVNYRLSLFGQVSYTLETAAPLKGLRVYSQLVGAKEDEVLVYNHNQQYFVRIRAGEPLAIITFRRVPFVFLSKRL